jgi:hypothetical protein
MSGIVYPKIKRGETHFGLWYSEYKPYIDDLWINFNESLENYIQEKLKYDYTDFVDFVYWHSSGIIN